MRAMEDTEHCFGRLLTARLPGLACFCSDVFVADAVRGVSCKRGHCLCPAREIV